MIEVSGITFSYNEKEVLKEISFKIEERERVVLLGCNGSGKSTILKILNGLIFPEKGKYFFKGQSIEKGSFKNAEFSKNFRKSNVMLFQSPDVMIFNPTCYDEIAFGLRQLDLPEKETREIVLRWAKLLEIEKYLNIPPFELSGGEKQKLILACLLALQPEVLLLDEPMANLDPKSQGYIIDLLWDLPVTSIISTHNLSLAPELGERAILLSEDHKIIYDGAIEELLSKEELLIEANLIHKHKHKHRQLAHSHYHKH
ncbi:MAG: ABC transporter ATP-binding protein [Thermoanaerobaculia bacterium]